MNGYRDQQAGATLRQQPGVMELLHNHREHLQRLAGMTFDIRDSILGPEARKEPSPTPSPSGLPSLINELRVIAETIERLLTEIKGTL